MAPIELFGWFLSACLMVCFGVSILFMLKKPKLFCESDYSSSQAYSQKAAQKNSKHF